MNNSNEVSYFTDGEVEVTRSHFQVKNTTYLLNKLYGHRVSIILPQRAPLAIVIALGVLIFNCGAINLLPANLSGSISIAGVSLMMNAVVMSFGVLLTLIATFMVIRQREKYEVKISTDGGEKTALISKRREYVNQIIDALNHAYIDLMENKKGKVR